MRPRNVSVRDLAGFLFRAGDLYPEKRGRSVEPEEGVAVQKRAQSMIADPGYQREVRVALEVDIAGVSLAVNGRADGLWIRADDKSIWVEEYKAVGALPEDPEPQDMGQACLYAALLAAGCQADEDLEGQDQLSDASYVWHVKLIYIQPDTFEQRIFTKDYSQAEMAALLGFCLLLWEARIMRHADRVKARAAWSNVCDFPFANFRAGQQAAARRVFRAQANGEHLLLEAPTGSGKSLSVLYPSVRGLGEDRQIFYLTAKNAGADAAYRALAQIGADSRALSAVEIIAKEKYCPVPGMPCGAATCERARGYFDRLPQAVDDVLELGIVRVDELRSIADRHTLCPFELALDTAVWADVVVGDYNYIFDPVVRLKRFIEQPHVHLLIDEAHQLVPRTQSMLRVELSTWHVAVAAKTGHAEMVKRVKSVDRALKKIRRQYGAGEHEVENLKSLDGACTKFLKTAAEEELELDEYPELRDLYFACHRWERAKTWIIEKSFVCIATVTDRAVTVAWCAVDPAEYLRRVSHEYGSAVRFSATLSPMPLVKRLQGLTEEDAAERAANPFDARQLLVMAVNDVSTYFASRRASLPRLVELILSLTAAEKGRYLLAMPSYEYLADVMAACGGSHLKTFSQSPGASLTDLAQLSADFAAEDHALLGIVMGGSLGESVDFSDLSLNGVIVVTLGLVPPSLERDLQARHFTEDEALADFPDTGQLVSYLYPAVTKILQTAGRLLRGPGDRGIVCLVDPRFSHGRVQQFFPSHWHPRAARADEVADLAASFWDQQDG